MSLKLDKYVNKITKSGVQTHADNTPIIPSGIYFQPRNHSATLVMGWFQDQNGKRYVNTQPFLCLALWLVSYISLQFL